MRYMDVCAGISAPTVAWEPLGWECAVHSEIDHAARAVLAYRNPNTPLHGDFTTIRGDEYGAIDLLVGGTPCQSFSVAGLRGGMDDHRGNLALEYLRLADRARPRWLVWENVPGVLSSNGGRDFGAILGGLVELGYGFAYRVLDAQFAGVPQRRRRVFVVGYLGDWRRAAAVLFERHSLSGNPAPRRQAGQGIAAGIAPCLGESGGHARPGDNIQSVGYLIPSTGDTSHCLNAGGMGRQDYETETLIAHSLRAEGFDASEDGTGRGTPLVLMERGRNGESSLEWRADGTSNAILTPNGGRGGLGVGAVCFDARQSDVLQYGDKAGPLDTDAYLQAVCFTAKDHGADASDISPTLRAGGHSGSHANAGVMPAVAFTASEQANSFAWERDVYPTLHGQVPNDSSNIQQGIRLGSAVRRLTPMECERLQGFPDDFTLVPYRGGMMKDGPRYKMLGNSMAVPVVRWIGERIQAVEALSHESLAA